MASNQQIRQKFPEYANIGRDYLIPLSSVEKGAAEGTAEYTLEDIVKLREYVAGILFGGPYYYIMKWKAIAIGPDGKFDNSVWELPHRYIPQEPGFPFISVCKIISFEFYRTRRILGAPLGVSRTVAECRALIVREANILSRLKHDNIVKLEHFIQIPDRETKFPCPYMILIMDKMHGTVDDLMRLMYNETEYPDGMPDDVLNIFLLHSLRALHYLHWGIGGVPGREVHIIHNAVRARNILYRIDFPNRICFKLGDFENYNGMIGQIGIDTFFEGFNQHFWQDDIVSLANIVDTHKTLPYQTQPDHPILGLYDDMKGVNAEGEQILEPPDNRLAVHSTKTLLENTWFPQPERPQPQPPQPEPPH